MYVLCVRFGKKKMNIVNAFLIIEKIFNFVMCVIVDLWVIIIKIYVIYVNDWKHHLIWIFIVNNLLDTQLFVYLLVFKFNVNYNYDFVVFYSKIFKKKN